MNTTLFGFNCESSCIVSGKGAIEAAVKAGIKVFTFHNVMDKHYTSAADFAERLWRNVWMNNSVNQPDPTNGNRPYGHPVKIILNIAYAPWFMMTQAQKNRIDPRFKDAGEYSNRWMPVDGDAYMFELRALLIALSRYPDMYAAIEFDLGQEPNSKRYWWDSFDDYADFSYLKTQVLGQYRKKYYGDHATASLLIDPDFNDGQEWYDWTTSEPDYSTSFYEVNSAGTFDYNSNYFPVSEGDPYTSILFPEVNYRSNLKDKTGDLMREFNSPAYMAFYIRFLKWSHEMVKARSEGDHTVVWYTLYDCSAENNKGLFGYWKKNKAGGFVKTAAWDHMKIFLSVVKDGWTPTGDGVCGLKQRIRVRPDGLSYEVSNL